MSENDPRTPGSPSSQKTESGEVMAENLELQAAATRTIAHQDCLENDQWFESPYLVNDAWDERKMDADLRLICAAILEKERPL